MGAGAVVTMSILGFLILALTIAVPVAWLLSEIHGNRPLRITLGILAIAVTTVLVSVLSTALSKFNYNAWYGGATKELLETSLNQIEDGHQERVLKVWRGLNAQYQPTYENRAKYLELVTEATARIRADTPIMPGSLWRAPMFSARTWDGHWENDTGFWIVTNDANPFIIWRSGDPSIRMQFVSLSEDCRVLTFQEGSRWLHTLTLKNKYEASHEWFNLENQAIWGTENMNKLIRATEEQKQMTQQVNRNADTPRK
jgi:hypothetical protein